MFDFVKRDKLSLNSKFCVILRFNFYNINDGFGYS